MDGHDRRHDIHDRTGFEQPSAQSDNALFHLRRNYRYHKIIELRYHESTQLNWMTLLYV